MAAKSVLPPLWEVPQEFRDRLGHKAGRQRAMMTDGHLLLVFHHPPGPEDVHRTGRFLWRQPDGTWNSSDLGAGPQALERHISEYADLLERYDRRVEEAATADELFGVLHALAPLHRSAMHMHHVLQEAREMCPEARDVLVYRDLAYDTERTAELLYNEARNTLDFAIAKRAEEQSHSADRMAASSHRLNLLVAFFFPIATLATVFGANLANGVEHFAGPAPLLTMVGVGLVFGILLFSFVSRGMRLASRPATPLRAGTPTGHGRRAPELKQPRRRAEPERAELRTETPRTGR